MKREDLQGKTIDVHTHAGVSLETYARGEYPYASTVEGLHYQQLAGGVDVSVVFPFTPHLHFDFRGVTEGTLRPAERPVSPAPYASENALLLREIYEYCPELAGHFLPFVSIDTEREIPRQLAALKQLWETYGFYGIKINPVLSQSHVRGLLGAGGAFLDFTEERNLPLLIHTSPVPGEEYSQTTDVFTVIDARPTLRFCLAHALLFYREFLDRAAAAPNVWVDTAALKIQTDSVRALLSTAISPSELIDVDLMDHRQVMAALCAAYPDTILWGTDAPAYAYICRRQDAQGRWTAFTLKGRYDDELATLRSLPEETQAQVANENTLDFLFGYSELR
ncbi:MAG: amidohydrolase family protein [Armatimonadota bacterium]